METNYFSVGMHKGEMDFSVNGAVADLSFEQMEDLRSMLVVGIGQLERMWRDAGEKRHPIASQPHPTDNS